MTPWKLFRDVISGFLTWGSIDDLEVEERRLLGIEPVTETSDAPEVGNPVDHHLPDRQNVA